MSDRGYPTLRLYIGGTWLDRASGGGTPVTNPATEEDLSDLPLAGS